MEEEKQQSGQELLDFNDIKGITARTKRR